MPQISIDQISPRSTMAVLACCDKNLFWQAAFLFERMLAHDPARELDYFLFVSDAPPQWLLNLLGPDVQVVFGTWELPEGVVYLEHLTPATLLRLFALDHLTPHYEKIGYTDIDVFFRWGSFAELRGLDMGDALLGAVREHSAWGGPVRRQMRAYWDRILPNAETFYFNAGILLVNSAPYAAAEVSAKCLALLGDPDAGLLFADQSALNAVVAGRWAELSPSWNWQVSPRNRSFLPLRNPRIVHFITGDKPWNDPRRMQDEVYIGLMHDFLRRHGLPAEGITPAFGGTPPRQERRRARYLDKRQSEMLVMWDEMAPYLDRQDFVDVAAGIRPYGWAEE